MDVANCSPKASCLGEPLRDETQLQEEADGALEEAVAQAHLRHFEK
jgi:hypothetical protein